MAVGQTPLCHRTLEEQSAVKGKEKGESWTGSHFLQRKKETSQGAWRDESGASDTGNVQGTEVESPWSTSAVLFCGWRMGKKTGEEAGERLANAWVRSGRG